MPRVEAGSYVLRQGEVWLHSGRHRRSLDSRVGAYLTYPAEKRRVIASTQNQALCALVFLYKHVLG